MTNLRDWAHHIRREAAHVRAVRRSRAFTPRAAERLDECERLLTQAADNLERYVELKATAFRPVLDVADPDHGGEKREPAVV